MKYLRRVGHVSCLLIVGVLVGLMAPLPSEAAIASLTLQLDSGTPVNILTGSTATCPTGYNKCYTVTSTPIAFGNNNKGYKVIAAPNTLITATKLLVNDISSQDAFKLTGVSFVPTSTASWPNTESHVLKIVMTNTYDAAPNGAGNYVFALRTGGYLQAGGTVSPIYTQYDFLKFEGTGTFSPTLVNVPLLNVAPATVNLKPLQLQVANTATATSFTLNQVVTYPTFACDADGTTGSGTQCKPIITLTMTATLYGPDSLVLTDSNDALGGGPCNLTSPDPGGGPSGNPAIPCHSSGKKKSSSDFIQQSFTANDSTDVTTAQTAGAVLAVQCVAADNCPCANPDDPQCAGTIIHNVKVTPETIETFPFTATGSGITASNYAITTNANGDGSKTFSPLPVIGEGPWTFVRGAFPTLPLASNKYWDIDSIKCASTLEPNPLDPTIKDVSNFDGFTTWAADGGSNKTAVVVHTMKGGDTLTCDWHIHKKSTSSLP
jgi:hypothetical protein